MSIKAPQLDTEEMSLKDEGMSPESSPESSSQIIQNIRKIMDRMRGAISLRILLGCALVIGATSFSGCKEKQSQQSQGGGTKGRPIEDPELLAAMKRLRQRGVDIKLIDSKALLNEIERQKNLDELERGKAELERQKAELERQKAELEQKNLDEFDRQQKEKEKAKETMPIQPTEPTVPTSAPAKETTRDLDILTPAPTVKKIADNKYIYVNEDGKNEFGDKEFKSASPFSEGIALVSETANDVHYEERYKSQEGVVFYYINRNGENAFEGKKFDVVKPFSEELAVVQERGEVKYYYMNRNGKNAFGDKTFKEANPFNKRGIALVRNHWAYGQDYYYYINIKGENTFGDKKFDEIGPFDEGLAVVRELGKSKYYYMNRKGENAFGDKQFDEAEPFIGGFARVKLGIRPFFIDKTGKQVKAPVNQKKI